MALRIFYQFADGSRQPVRDDFNDLIDAVRYGLRLAVTHRRDPGDGHGPPEAVLIVDTGLTILAISVSPNCLNQE